jgi:crotonobetainyl-CoA:carnitine CoA-transferase CaiB-like acyl-CoA transferase
MDAVPAWLELDEAPRSEPATWSAVARAVERRDRGELLARAELLGLAVAVVEEATGSAAIVESALGEAPARRDVRGLRVIDLSPLWAGPLCGDLLARAGADVIKVESTSRPDGARRGPPAFFDLLNGRKRSVALDFGSSEGAGLLRELVRRADIVIEASRPRALEQFGIAAADMVRSGGPRVWISITGHGRAANRIAFGDDAAAAGGLVVWRGTHPQFCADALGDPLTGLTAAYACLEAVARGGRWLLDISMSGVSAAYAGSTLPTPSGTAAAAPRARPVDAVAPALGADTAAVLAKLGIAR